MYFYTIGTIITVKRLYLRLLANQYVLLNYIIHRFMKYRCRHYWYPDYLLCSIQYVKYDKYFLFSLWKYENNNIVT